MVDNMITAVELRLKELRHEPRADAGRQGTGPPSAASKSGAGARPLRRTSPSAIEDSLAEKMLFGEVGPARSWWSTSRARARLRSSPSRAKVGALPDMPPFETADVEAGPPIGPDGAPIEGPDDSLGPIDIEKSND